MTMTNLEDPTTIRTPEYQSRPLRSTSVTSGPVFEGRDVVALVLMLCMALGPLGAYALGFVAGI